MTLPSASFSSESNRPTILVVDDEPANLQALGDLLQTDYRVRVANSGATALRVAASSPRPDLILLDILMSDMDGFQVIEALRADVATCDIPVIFVTALDDDENERRGFELGAVDFLGKPIRPAIVLARVRNHLDLKRARDIFSDRAQELSRRIQRIFEFSRDILCVLGFDGYFKEINPAATAILDWREDELRSRPWRELVHPEDLDAARRAAQQLIDGLPLRDVELRFRHRRGHYCWLSWNAFPVRREGASFCVVRDVTAHKEVEAKMEAFSEALSWQVEYQLAQNRQKDLLLITQSRLATMGDLLHNVAHHWRQPLNALAVLLANIKDAYEFNELTEEYLSHEVAKGNKLVQEMSATIDEFRNLFNSDGVRSLFNLDALVGETLALLGAPFASLGIVAQRQSQGEVLAFASRPEVTQILVSLLNNARDAIVATASTDKRIVIRLANTEGFATLSVEDRAGGIPTDILDKIFNPYFTTRPKSAGIGLYLAQMLATRQDGRIEADNLDGGARVTLSLPNTAPPT